MTAINTPDRRALLFGDAPVAPPAHTPAQQQASRVNGSKSHGPVTSVGLARSSKNAIKHGLLSRFVAPLDDARGYGVLYRRIRRGLLAELAPSSFFARTLVDTLAYDLVLLARAKGMMETLFPAPTIAPEEDRAWRGTRWAKVACRRTSAALEHLKTGNPWAMPEAGARQLAQHLADLLAAVEEDLTDAADPECITERIDVELRRPQTAMG